MRDLCEDDERQGYLYHLVALGRAARCVGDMEMKRQREAWGQQLRCTFRYPAEAETVPEAAITMMGMKNLACEVLQSKRMLVGIVLRLSPFSSESFVP